MIRSRRETVDIRDSQTLSRPSHLDGGEENLCPDSITDKTQFAWFVLVTKPHQEYKVYEAIKQSSLPNVLEVYLPNHQTLQAVRVGKIEKLPLLGCRVFVYTTKDTLLSFVQLSSYSCSPLYDRTQHTILTVPDPEMRCFMDYNRRNLEELLVLERPYRDYLFDPSKGRENIRARVIDGPFAGMEGVLIRVRKDHRLVFRMGNIALSLPNVWQWHLMRIHDEESDKKQRMTPEYRAWHLHATLEALRVPEPADDLRWMLQRLQEDASFAALHEEALRLSHDKGGKNGKEHLAYFLKQLTPDLASDLQSLSFHLTENPVEADRLLAERGIAPFLTPPIGTQTVADEMMGVHTVTDDSESHVFLGDSPIAVVRPQRTIAYADRNYVEYVLPVYVRERRSARERETSCEVISCYEAHVGAGCGLLFADFHALVDLYRSLDAVALSAQNKTLAEYHPTLLQVLEGSHPLGFSFRDVCISPNISNRYCLTLAVADTFSQSMDDMLSEFTQFAVSLLLTVSQSTHLAIWRRTLGKMWLR